MPETVPPGEILPPISIDEDAPRMEQARKQVDAVSKAVTLYISRNKNAPPSLEALAQPGIDEKGNPLPPYLEAAALLDPWGASIRFDPAGPFNKHSKPDVYSLGPPSGSVFIGNWSDKPTPAEDKPLTPPR
jgi:hypothetical protein